MANKSNFTAEEWRKVLEAPLLAGFAVSAGDPSGLIGTLQEGLASAKALAAAKADANADELIKAVVEDLLTPEGRTAARDGVKTLIQGAKLSEIKGRALAELEHTAAVLDSKAPTDAKAFKNWLNYIAKMVAEAGTEGGFLGLGGEKVTDSERATLAEISTALGAQSNRRDENGGAVERRAADFAVLALRRPLRRQRQCLGEVARDLRESARKIGAESADAGDDRDADQRSDEAVLDRGGARLVADEGLEILRHGSAPLHVTKLAGCLPNQSAAHLCEWIQSSSRSIG